jgi:hypothetical protein
MDRLARRRLIASPQWPPPSTTVVVLKTFGPWLQVTSTVTSVGLVRMSKTAECFCDWATSAFISSAVASASIC